jgi:hypothetical protein
MPAADYDIAQGDHGETITSTLEDSAQQPVDLEGANIAFRVVPIGGSTPLLDNVVASNGQNGDGSDGTKGRVFYTWQPGDTGTPGVYLAQWKATFVDESVQSFPNDGYLLIRISPTP